MNPNEDDRTLIIYPEQSVTDGLLAVSPQLLTELASQAALRGAQEGDISLRIRYEDFRDLATIAGYTVKEIRKDVEL